MMLMFVSVLIASVLVNEVQGDHLGAFEIWDGGDSDHNHVHTNQDVLGVIVENDCNGLSVDVCPSCA